MLLGGAFSALSAAISELPEERLLALREEGGMDGATADRLLRERILIQARLLTGRVLSVAGVAGLAAHIASCALTHPFVLGAVGISAMLYAIFAEFVHILVRRRAAKWGLRLFRWLRPIEALVVPLAWPLVIVARYAERMGKAPSIPPHIAEREVEHLLEKREEEGTLPQDQAELLLNVLEFKDTTAREVMVPRTLMVAIDISMPFEDVVDRVLAEGHSRYPVYRGQIDCIEGILHAKDLFKAYRQGKRNLEQIMRKTVLFAPESQKISQLLREMQARRQHLAVVVDEFGSTRGIVTLEDIIEEIVGEIQDEHDSEESLITEVAPGHYLVDARLSIHDFEELTNIQLDKEGIRAESLGGLVVEELGRLPNPGEKLVIGDTEFVIRQADGKRVQRLEIIRHAFKAGNSIELAKGEKQGASILTEGTTQSNLRHPSFGHQQSDGA
ncbi:MAG: hemolysin family protein [Deltaproteobacteria bacterium]|nr:hemolysin family protein [Deltaproteobacteria bacterium]